MNSEYGSYGGENYSMAKNEPRKWLLNALKKTVVKDIEARGFKQIPFSKSDIADREFRSSLPFGKFHRRAKNGLHILEIEFAVRSEAKFRIVAGVFPPEGLIDIFSQPVKPEDAWVHTLSKSYVLDGGNKRKDWFYVPHWFWQTPTRQQYEDLATTVLGFIPELEDALNNGVIGSHLKFEDTTESANKMRIQLQRQKEKNLKKKRASDG